MQANIVGLIVPTAVLAVVVVFAVRYFRNLPGKRADLRRRQAAGEAAYETKGHLAMRLTLAAALLAVAIVGTIYLASR